MKADNGTALELCGGPRERGLAQAALEPDHQEQVRKAVYGRLEPVAAHLLRPAIADWLSSQKEHAVAEAPEEMEETAGIAEGYGLGFDDLFAYLHLGILHDMLTAPAASSDGCTTWAASDPDLGAVMAKNRDFRGEHVGLQRVFRHADPAWSDRRILCVGSLGSPGAYSSGINSDGLAVADTQIGTTDHGVGLVRYFVMTRLLTRARNVTEALDILAATRHAGGGSIVLADASGAVAAVELGFQSGAISSCENSWIARTNHFLSPTLQPKFLASRGDPMAASSQGRLKTVTAAVTAWHRGSLVEAGTLMASHDSKTVAGDGAVGLCRHGEDGDASTISTSLFTCAPATLYFCAGNPCAGDWLSYRP